MHTYIYIYVFIYVFISLSGNVILGTFEVYVAISTIAYYSKYNIPIVALWLVIIDAPRVAAAQLREAAFGLGRPRAAPTQMWQLAKATAWPARGSCISYKPFT